jgi:hypothetical protein
LNDVNPFTYINQITSLLRHHSEAISAPGAWLRWNYHLQLPRPPDDDPGGLLASATAQA